MNEPQTEPTIDLLHSDDSDVRFREALIELFDGDGTVYLVSGYFTYQGYLAIRDAVVSFLERSRENELVAIVGPASDQFSARIARDLWALDDYGQVSLYKQPRGLHAKLYVRDGPNPICIVGSGNITQVAFEYNVELNVVLRREHSDHPDVAQFLDWVDDIVAASEPLRRRDLLAPVLIGGTLTNWTNKARLLSVRDVAIRVVPVLLLLLVLSVSFRLL
ncbi:phospholipase D family protein [Natronococcus sp.]|uniref:phospholipase D family protein n=1 Tax=Natronococcus sp. TaxID=35747 RepID=UPI003A4D4A55